MKPTFDILIDKLTNSIEHVLTGTSYETSVLPLTKADLPLITKKKGWLFNWRKEFGNQDGRKIMKLVTAVDPQLIHGLISYKKVDGFYFIPLIESAPFNISKNKLYHGVPGNLVAHVCKESFENACDGIVSFTPKTRLIAHYEATLGAIMINKTDMAIFTKEARFLVNLYYKDNQ
jgi:hypothetical protein